MRGKRGISAVIVTMIIIFLALVSTGIVWGVVKNIISSGSDQISLGSFTTDVEIQSVKVGEETVDVDVKRNVGGGDVTRLKFVFSDGQDSGVIERTVSLEELEQEKFTFFLSQLPITSLKTVSVSPVFISESGKETIGKVQDEFEFKEGEEVVWEEIIGNFQMHGPVGWEKADYHVSSGGSEKLPRIERIVIDPLDVKVGDNQTFIVYASSPHGVTEVTSRTELDTETLILPLEKTENENEYMATWTVYDTHTRDYRTNFTARDSAGNENTVPMSWTDPCTDINDHGQLKEITSACVASSGTDGIDNGNITIRSTGSITLNGGTFIRTPGFSMIFDGGTLTLAGGEVREAYLFYDDGDGDGYGGSYDWSSSSSLSGHVRAKDATGEDDCNDGDADVFQQISSLSNDDDQDGYTGGSAGSQCVGTSTTVSSRTYYKDTSGSFTWLTDSQKLGTSDCNDGDADIFQTISASTCTDVDQDRYSAEGVSCATNQCLGSKSSFWYQNSAGSNIIILDSDTLGSSDCLDSSSDVHPGQTSYFTTHRGDGSFDYNCDSSETKRYSAGGSCSGVCSTDEPPCSSSSTGSVGYTSSSPACGVAGNYVTDRGDCFESGPFTCSEGTCSQTSRTQECR